MSAQTRPPAPSPIIPGAATVVAQFSHMMADLQAGWEKGPAGHKCGLCSGPIWIKDIGGYERHRCGNCGACRDVRVK